MSRLDSKSTPCLIGSALYRIAYKLTLQKIVPYDPVDNPHDFEGPFRLFNHYSVGGYNQIVYPDVPLHVRCNSHALDFRRDTWILRLATRFSPTGEPTNHDVDRAAECIEIMFSEMMSKNYTFIPSHLEHVFRMQTTAKYHHITRSMISQYLMDYPYTHLGDVFKFGDFDEYRIERLYPPLYELILGEERFSRILAYRETVPPRVQEYIDHMLYTYTFKYGQCVAGSYDREDVIPDNACLLKRIVLQNPDCIGLYDNVLFVRKGAETPVFDIGTRRVPATFHKTHTGVMLAVYTIENQHQHNQHTGTVFKDWGIHVSSVGLEFLYGFDIHGAFKVIWARDVTVTLSKASFKTRYIFKQLLEGGEWDFNQDGRIGRNIMSDLEQNFPHHIQTLIDHIDLGFDLEAAVEQFKQTHTHVGCDCNLKMDRLFRMMS